MTPAEIIDKAIESSTLTKEQVENLPAVSRFAIGDQVYAVRQECAPGLTVFALFEGSQRDPLETHLAGDVRVYCVPTPGTTAAPHCCFRMSRQQPTMARTEYKDAAAFAEEIGEEWLALAEALGEVGDDDDDEMGGGVVCEACGFDTLVADEVGEEDAPPVVAKFCGNCGRPVIDVVAAAQANAYVGPSNAS